MNAVKVQPVSSLWELAPRPSQTHIIPNDVMFVKVADEALRVGLMPSARFVANGDLRRNNIKIERKSGLLAAIKESGLPFIEYKAEDGSTVLVNQNYVGQPGVFSSIFRDGKDVHFCEGSVLRGVRPTGKGRANRRDLIAG